MSQAAGAPSILDRLESAWDRIWGGDAPDYQTPAERKQARKGGVIEGAPPKVYGVEPDPSWYDMIQTWLGSDEPTVKSPEASAKPKGGADWLLIGAGAVAVYLAIKE